MNKTKINVPRDIKYLSDWKEFTLLDFPYILNKQLTGCGFTQWVLTNDQNIILCSPRRILLDNKEDKYIEECESSSEQCLNYNLLYARNDMENIIKTDCNMNKDARRSEVFEQPITETVEHIEEFKLKIKDFYTKCQFNRKYCKILVTYDSYRKVKEALEEIKAFDQFYVVVDEMQSIFVDSRFKSTTELEFVSHLQETKRICYASATPMMEKYLDQLDEFKDLPYYELDWSALDPSRVIKPRIISSPCSKINQKALEIIDKYRTGTWKDMDGSTYSWVDENNIIQELQSKEAVFYINSVKNICDIIRMASLKQEECNILCADTEENRKAIQKAFGVKKRDFLGLGKVPRESEMDNNRMFTFCTRTVYLGADFYSRTARSFVFSDANIDCLAVDITLDLPQILGRQRNFDNPWKNELNIYFKPTVDRNIISEKDFNDWIARKKETTADLLRSIKNQADDIKAKSAALDKYDIAAKTERYRNDYLAINYHSGSSKEPVFNNLVLVAEQRAFDIQQVDYADRCSVRNTISEQIGIDNNVVYRILGGFESRTTFIDKMKYLCIVLAAPIINEEVSSLVLRQVDQVYSNYYTTLGSQRIRSLSYRRDRLEEEYKKITNNQTIDLTEVVLSVFKVGDKIPKADIKVRLSDIYKKAKLKNVVPKASDLEEWFDLRAIKVKDSGGKWVHGFELIRKK